MSELYFVLKWYQNMRHKGWPRYEVRPMRGLEQDNRWTAVKTDLTFEEADKLRKNLEGIHELGRRLEG